MKMSRTFIPKSLLAGVLVAGMGIVAVPAAAQQSAALTTGAVNAPIMLAETKLKGRPPYKRHTVHTQQQQQQQQQEQAQFARLEERPGVAKDGHRSMYHGVRGKRPPYRRN